MLYETMTIDKDKIVSVVNIEVFRIRFHELDAEVYRYALSVNYIYLADEYKFQDFWVYRDLDGEWVNILDNHPLSHKLKSAIGRQEKGPFRNYVNEYLNRA